MSFKIEIQENGVSIQESEILYDAQGNPVQQSNSRRAIGIGDFPDPTTYQTRVRQMLEGIYGTNLASLVSENAMIKNHRNQLQAENATIRTERDNVKLERDNVKAERDAAEAAQTAAEAARATAIQERDAALAAQTAAETARDIAIAERDAARAERDAARAERDAPQRGGGQPPA